MRCMSYQPRWRRPADVDGSGLPGNPDTLHRPGWGLGADLCPARTDRHQGTTHGNEGSADGYHRASNSYEGSAHGDLRPADCYQGPAYRDHGPADRDYGSTYGDVGTSDGSSTDGNSDASGRGSDSHASARPCPHNGCSADGSAHRISSAAARR